MSWRSKQVLVLLCTVVGCGGGEEQPEAQGEAETVAAQRVEPLSNAQAVGVLTTMSTSAAEAAATALPVVSLAELRRLLSVMRADHQALQAELRAIADSLQIAPVEHPATQRLRTAGQAAVTAAAQAAEGSADAAVLNQQIALQETLLAVLDSAVLPGLQPSLIAEYARAMRPTLAAHLQRAHQIEVLLRNRPARAAAPSPSPAASPPASAEPGPAPAVPATVDTTTPAPAPPDTTPAALRTR